MNQFNILTIYPDFFKSFNKHGLIKKGLEKEIIHINIIDLRLHTQDKHNRVDFKTYGGGPGMVIQYQPVKDSLKTIKSGKCYFLSPQGKTLNQKKLIKLSKEKNITLLCGRYEGVDQRVIDNLVDEEISIGDYVISGGEIPCMTIIEGITRLLPGVVDDFESIKQDSFQKGILDHPHYTRPEEANGWKIPDVLSSGNHENIDKWRKKQALGATWIKRRELLKDVKLSIEDDKLLKEYIAEYKKNGN